MQIGETLGPYRILGLLGQGGMGAVYKAHDTRLNRVVAIKRTTEEFRGRFEREARAIAALNHPHVCHLYDVGPDYLVMEYVDGAPVSPVASARTLLDLAVQIADGLAAAHVAGIVHRDLKPANILVTAANSESPNQVKVLDFGVALHYPSSALEGLSRTETRPAHATAVGSIVGTIAYMSPEQARGEPVTPQSDQFSFGVVLFELASGRNPFVRDSTPETLTAIIREDAPPLPNGLPPQLRWIIERLLSKNPGDRYDSTRDLYRELRVLRDKMSDTTQSLVAPGRTTSQRTLNTLLATAAAIALLTTVGWVTFSWLRPGTDPEPPPGPLIRSSIDLPAATMPPQVNFALAPDASRIVYQARDTAGVRLMVRSLADSTILAVAGSENAQNPFFSPDGKWLGFARGGQVVKVPVAGGAPVVVTTAAVLAGATWGPSGLIVAPFGTSEQLPTQASLGVVPETGGTVQPLAPLAAGEATHRWPQFLPDGEHVLYTAHRLLDVFDDASIRVVSVKTRESKTVVSGGYFGRYLPSGHLVFMRGGILYGVRFDRASLTVQGKPVPLLDDVASSAAWGAAQFAFSESGVFLYRQPGSASWPLVWMDRAGQVQPLLARPASYYTPRLSPDGNALAYSGRPSDGDIYVYEWQRDKTTRITSDGLGHLSPVWSADGKHVVYRTYLATTGEFALDWSRADGGGEPHRLLSSRSPLLPGDVSPNGDLVYTQGDVGYDIWTVKLDLTNPDRPSAGPPVPVVRTASNELQPVLSPDGRWLAYVSNPPGQGRAVFVRPFPPAANAPERRWQVSAGAGDLPVWSRNGQLFHGFYGTTDSTAREIYEVPYRISGDNFVADKPRRWSTATHRDLDLFRSFDASPNGERAVVAPPIEADALDRSRTRPALLLNFFDEVARRIPQ